MNESNNENVINNTVGPTPNTVNTTVNTVPVEQPVVNPIPVQNTVEPIVNPVPVQNTVEQPTVSTTFVQNTVEQPVVNTTSVQNTVEQPVVNTTSVQNTVEQPVVNTTSVQNTVEQPVVNTTPTEIIGQTTVDNAQDIVYPKPRIVTPEETNLPSNFSTTPVTKIEEVDTNVKKKTNPLLIVIIFVVLALLGFIGYYVYDTYFKVYAPINTGYTEIKENVLANYYKIEYYNEYLVKAYDSDGKSYLLTIDGTKVNDNYLFKLNDYVVYKENTNFYYMKDKKKSDLYTSIKKIHDTDLLILTKDNVVTLLNTKDGKEVTLECNDIVPSIDKNNELIFTTNKYIVANKLGFEVLFNLDGSLVDNISYLFITPINDDIAIAQNKDAKYGIIDYKNNVKMEFIYDYITITPNYIVTVKDNNISLYDKKYTLIKENIMAIDIKNQANQQLTVNEVDNELLMEITDSDLILYTFIFDNTGAQVNKVKGKYNYIKEMKNPIYYEEASKNLYYYTENIKSKKDTLVIYNGKNEKVYENTFTLSGNKLNLYKQDKYIYIANASIAYYLDAETLEKVDEKTAAVVTLSDKTSYAYLKNENLLEFYNENGRTLSTLKCTNFQRITEGIYIINNKLEKIEYK